MAAARVAMSVKNADDALKPTRKPKAVISTSAMFKRPLPPLRPTAASKSLESKSKTADVTKDASSRAEVGNAILKKPGIAKRRAPEHPLSVAFNGTHKPHASMFMRVELTYNPLREHSSLPRRCFRHCQGRPRCHIQRAH